MHQSFMRNGHASIINLFQKMDSNITKFRASLHSSPSPQKQEDGCNCSSLRNDRNAQQQFYTTQEQLVRIASANLRSEGNETLAKLLAFMSEYLGKIREELRYEVVCCCKAEKLQTYGSLLHKIGFLREENHKFFKMIEEKSEECESLREKIEELSRSTTSHLEEDSPTLTCPLNSRPPSLLSQLTSRIISSNSSRVSQFRHGWPELTLPVSEVGHRRYFESGSGERCGMFQSREVLQQKCLNRPVESTFRKGKIFDH